MERPANVVDFIPDHDLFPFESKWFDSRVGPVHYVDEGEGRPLLLLHGNPDWSFLYRKIISGLRDTFRCVAPDYPGFGLSVHPDGYGYTPAEHAAVITELVEHLDLQDLVVMGQDWGGPIGMDIASRKPERIRGLVMGNTWFWPADSPMMKVFSRALGSRPGQWLITERNFFVEFVMKRSLIAEVSDREFDHYRTVAPTAASRQGFAVFPREILGSGPWLADIEQRVPTTLAAKDVVLVFGLKDTALAHKQVIARWRKVFPNADYVELPNANHYIQEDAPDEIVTAIRSAFS